MPIASRHPEYDKFVAAWEKCRDCVNGEDAVKNRGPVYLPTLSGMNDDEYEAYKTRALFYSASGRTVKGLSGAILRKEPVVEFPQPEMLQAVGPRGESIGHVIKETVQELITTGRYILLIDSAASEEQPDAPPYIALYSAESLTNWDEQVVNGRKQLTMATLKEESYKDEDGDPFAKIPVERYRLLTLEDWDTPNPYLKVQLWEKDEDVEEESEGEDDEALDDTGPFAGFTLIMEVEPKFLGGKPVPYIPLAIINPGDNGPEVEVPPILDLVNTNLSHYRNSADYEHGIHFTALPTPYATGVEGDVALRIGSGTAWTISVPEAKVGMLEFTGAGLASIASSMKSKEEKMAILGARLLEAQKADAEAAATVALRHRGEESVLTNIVHNIAEGLTLALTWLAEWNGIGDQKITVQLNTDFNPSGLDAPTLQQLMFSVQGGLISWDTWFYNLKQSDFIPDGRTPDEEKALIEAGNPQGPAPEATPGTPGQGGAPGGTPVNKPIKPRPAGGSSDNATQ